MRCAKCEKELHDCQCPWVKTYSGGKPNYTEPCFRCGKVNLAEIHTCTPNLTTKKNIQISDNND